MAQPRIYVQAPPVTPLPFGIFSAATVLDSTDPHFQLGGVQYEPDYCGPARATSAPCTETPPNLVDTDGVPLITADPFVVYQVFTCKAPGSYDRGAERARTSLTSGEQRGVEAGLGLILPGLAGAVDLTPTAGVPMHPVDGLAVLEEYAAANYGGVPVVHIPRRVGTVLTTLGAVARQGVQLQTVQGALVASGGGYQSLKGPAGVTAAAGARWLYITGQVQLHRALLIEVSPTIALSPATNIFRALAERVWAATTECIVGAVLVSTDYATPTT